jgi:tetratricopeptide (TPR) repeat protein
VARLLPPSVVLVAGLLAFWNSFYGVFVFDDQGHIVTSEQIRKLWPVSTWLDNNARPFVTLTLALNYHFGKLNEWGYHLGNLVVHLAAALVLYGLVRRTLLHGDRGLRYRNSAHWLAGAVALLWVVHPLQTQSVTYIIQRSESLMGLLYLLVHHCFLRAEPGPRRWPWQLLCVAACALGLATKAVMVVAPLTVLLYDRVFLSRSFGALFRARWPVYLGLVSTLVVIQFVGLFNSVLNPSPGYAVSVGFGLQGITWWQYLRTQPEVILHYLRLCVWPDPLCLDYEWPVAGSGYYARGALILALLAATGIALWRRPAAGFLPAVFFVVLGPSSSFIPVKDLAMEHRMYLPLACVIALLVLGGHALLRRALGPDRPFPPGLAAAVGVLVLAPATALAVATHYRNRVYYTSADCWRDVTLTRPRNPRAFNNLGEGHSAAGEKFRLARDAARLEAEQARAAGRADQFHARQAEAAEADRRYKGKLADAAEAFRGALRLKPDLPDAHYNLGKALYELGDFAGATHHYQQSKRFAPRDLPAYIMLGNLLVDLGRLDEAAAEFQAAIQARTRETDKTLVARAYYNLGNTYARQERLTDAIAQYNLAIQAHPGYPNGYYGRGWAMERLGRRDDAQRDYQAALELNPDYGDARIALEQLRKAPTPPAATRP